MGSAIIRDSETYIITFGSNNVNIFSFNHGTWIWIFFVSLLEVGKFVSKHIGWPTVEGEADRIE